MTDTPDGSRDARGYWSPDRPADTAPLFAIPPRPLAILHWLPQYFLPYNVIFAASALVWWGVVVPPIETLQTVSPGWVLRLLAVNAAAVFAWYFAFEAHLYIRRAQGMRYKYNAAFPADRPGAVFWFRSQNRENILRTFLSGVPIWTALQVVTLWAFANGWGTWLSWSDHWPWLVALGLLVPVLHEAHFYVIHRLIHTRWLYRHVHSVHHKSVNPSPWSSLAMHPVEHLLYFSGILYHLILPSHPLLAIYQLHVAGFGAVPGHVGFHRVEVGQKTLDTHAQLHFLHHRFFEVNYGDGLIPFDRWFGTFHDGSDAATQKMRARLKRQRQG